MLHTSVEDLQKWDENFYSAQVGGKEILAAMQEQVKVQGRALESAKGLFIRDYRGLYTEGYSGGSGGCHSFLLRFPEQHFSVACLCNGGVRASKRAYKVAEVYLERSMKPMSIGPGMFLTISRASPR